MPRIPLLRAALAALAALVAAHVAAFDLQPARALIVQKRRAAAPSGARNAARDREIAARFAPVFYQSLGDHKRGDYVTRFDFDGDWRGDNNWSHADDQRFKLRAYVYFAVSETLTHFLVHYAVFHPRDYKGGRTGPLLSEAIREGVRRGGRYDPTGLSDEAVLAHENDMEGCLVVAAKDGVDLARARVVAVETLAHDRFLKYAPEGGPLAVPAFLRTDGQRPLLYVEPKGHGVSAFDGGEKQTSSRHGTLVYKFTGQAEDPEAVSGDVVGYDLLPLSTTLWPRARGGANETYARALDYGAFAVSVSGAKGKAAGRKAQVGSLGAAFRGGVGAPNAARPPWGWFDREEKGQPAGAWFFDPAATVKRHFQLGEDFSTVYLHAPFVGVIRR